MADIHIIPGVERRDLAGPLVPSAEVLQAAIDNGVLDAIVVGRSRDGAPYVACSLPDVDKIVGMLMRAVSMLSDNNIGNTEIVEAGRDA